MKNKFFTAFKIFMCFVLAVMILGGISLIGAVVCMMINLFTFILGKIIFSIIFVGAILVGLTIFLFKVLK